jgi:hypothetical protein
VDSPGHVISLDMMKRYLLSDFQPIDYVAGSKYPAFVLVERLGIMITGVID